MLRLRTCAALGFALLLASAPAWALSTTYSVIMNGANEVPGPGDPDGAASGTITLDDVTGQISWSFIYSNLGPVSDMHIHGPGGSAGSAAGVFVGLGAATTGGAGTLINSTTTTPANVAAIFANPTDFYVNIHTNPGFPAGAVRGQLGTVVPEPAPAALIGLGVIAIAMSRRRIAS
jgi:CHRD domain-containing protein